MKREIYVEAVCCELLVLGRSLGPIVIGCHRSAALWGLVRAVSSSGHTVPIKVYYTVPKVVLGTIRKSPQRRSSVRAVVSLGHDIVTTLNLFTYVLECDRGMKFVRVTNKWQASEPTMADGQ